MAGIALGKLRTGGEKFEVPLEDPSNKAGLEHRFSWNGSNGFKLSSLSNTRREEHT